MTATNPSGPRLLLDVDGVLNATGAPEAWDCDPLVVEDDFELDDGPHSLRLVFAPAQLAALEELIADFDIELRWLTSWCQREAIAEQLAPRLPFAAGRTAAVEPHATPLWVWKPRTVLGALPDGRPTIWADDLEVRGVTATWLRKAGPTPQLLLAPETDLGLTPAHLQMMREFCQDQIGGVPRMKRA